MNQPDDFDLLKPHQYCDNPKCSSFMLKGGNNIRTYSRSKKQVYCSVCKNRWVVTRGTIYFGLKTPLSKVIQTLWMLAQGNGLRKTCRQQGITPNTVKKWMIKAGEYPDDFSHYMQQNMQFEKHQRQKIWAFIQMKLKSFK